MVQLGAWRSAVEWFRRLSWRSLRIPGLFLVSVALLTLMYRLRSDRIDKEEAEKASEINSVLLMASINVPKTGKSSTRGPMTLWPDEADLSELASHERWVVVSGVEEEERGGGGAAAAEMACTLAAAVKAHGWRPIVIGEGMNCCRLPDCVPLDNTLLSRLPYRVLRFIKSSPLPQSSSPPTSAPTAAPQPPSHPSALRNAAFLFAIQHGARFVFDAYPPDGDPGALTSWAEEIFSSMVLGTSVGLVLDGHSYSFPTSVPGAPTPRVLNPYAHFGRPDLWAKGYDVHDADEYHQQHLRYRVCEIRQPSVEMFLDVWDGGPADLIAPPVTVPSSVLAPYGSRNVLYTRDAFWGLALFPGIGKNFSSSSSSSSKLSPNLARALWNHALLGATLDAGGVRFSLVPGTQGINSNKSNSIISRLYSEEDHSIPTDLRAYVSTFTSRVLRWRCRSTTLLPCLSQLASDFLAISLLTPEDAAFMEAWVTDLRRVRYLPPPTLPWSPRPPPRPPGPCIHPPHHHHRQLHDPPLPHPTTLTFHPIHLQRPAATIPASMRVLIARFHRDAALLEWSVGSDRTKEEVTLVEETLTEDRLLSDEESKSEGTPQSKVREENLSRKVLEQPGEKEGEEEEEEEEEATDHPLSLEVASTRTFLGDVADHLCPGFAPLASPLLPHRPSSLKLEDVLLVVWFPRQPRYDLLPALELLRTRHFPNALFCGPPHRALPSMLSRFDGRTSPSFLTATSRADCLLTALEMGYRVGDEGSLLLVEESALPIPWSLSERNRSLIWFHSEKEEEIRNKRNTRDSDGKPWEGADFGQGGRRTFFRGPEESVIMAAEGLASALRFMARLMGVRPNPHLHPHHHPMEEMEHEEAPWGRMPGNTTHHPNVTEDSSSTNETSTAFSEKIDVENTTFGETPIVMQEKTNDTGEVAAIVEEIIITEFEQTKAPVVEHIDTPSVEYSEPVVVEYTEPPALENKNIAEVEEIKPLSEVKEDIPSIEPDDTHVEDKVKTSGEEEKVEFLGDKNQNSSVEGSKDDVDTSVKEYEGIGTKVEIDSSNKEYVDNAGQEHIGNPEKEHLDTPDKGQEGNPDEEHVDASDKEHFDTSKEDEVQVDILEKEHVDIPEKEYIDNPDKEHVKTPAEDQVDAPVEEHVETPEEEHIDVPEEEKTDTPDKNHFDTPRVEHVDTPAIEYSEPHELEHFEAIKIDPLNVNGTLDLHTVEQGNGSIIDRTALEIKLDANETVTILSETSILKHDQNFSTEWPSIVNVTDIPWNDNDTKFELPHNVSSSDWVTSADAEEILSSITMIEHASENNTKEPGSHDEVVTEYFVNAKVNLTHLLEEANNSSLQQNFEIKSPELYEDARDEEEVVGVGEQSLLEQDTLLSYKDVEDTPQFVGLPSSTAKSHAKSLETSISVPVSFEGERRKRDTSDGRANYSIDGFKEQFMKPRDSQEDAMDEGRSGLAVSVRLSRSLQEIEELFTELASGFPEDAEAVLREEGNPEVLSYPSPHYGLDHTDFRHLHCDYADMEDEEGDGDWGESDSLHFEPCTVLRRFFLRLYYSHKSENSLLHLLSLATTRGSAPIFHLPMRLQRELHLTASLLLSQGFPEEGVLPLLVYGLAGESGWVNLKKGSFGDTNGPFPVFDDNSDFIHPTNLRLVPEEPRLRSVFCLKFLLRVLDG